MRLGFRTLSLVLFGTATCTQVIGLGSYEKTEEESDGAGASGKTGSGGSLTGGAGASFGGSAGNTPTAGETSAGEGGTGATGATGNEGGSAGSGAEGGGAAGKPTAPIGGEGGGAGDGGGGEGGWPAVGGTGTGGTAGQGGNGGKGGTAGNAGKGGTAGSAGKGGTAGNAGKGGSGGGPCTRELLVDGAFDQESSAWIQYSDDDLAVIWAPSSRTPHTAPNVAWIGGSSPVSTEEYYYSEVSQLVTVPVGTVSLTASCQILISTDEGDDGPFDFAEVALYVENGGERIARFRRFSDLDYTNGWEAWTQTLNTASYNIQGARVLFVLTGAEDYSNITDFMFDTCSLVAQVCN